MNNNNSIEVRDMSKSFKVVYDKPQTLKERIVFWNNTKVEHREILKHINLDIQKGETVALIGTNGSGKSTLLKLMTKILYPTQGSLVTRGKLTSLLELGAGFHPDFTGRENIYFNAAIFGLTRDEIDNRLNDIIEFSELEEFIDNPIRTYSSGMYMRLAFSIAINVDAEILLIDEILAVGDQHFQDKCFNKLQELKNSDKTIVIVSHSLDSVKQLCTRAIWIYKGEIAEDGDPTYVIDKYLERCAEDYKKKANKKVEKKDVYEGILYIESPKSFDEVSKEKDLFTIGGWELSETDKSKVIVSLDGNNIEDINRFERMDVIDAYEEKYGGLAANKEPGWTKDISLKNIEVGLHTLSVSVLDENNKMISKKEVSFNVM